MTRERDPDAEPSVTPVPIPRARDSAAAQWPALAGFVAAEGRLQEAALARGRAAAGLYEFVRFGLKQGWACLFGGLLLALMLGTRLVWPAHAPIARYDALFLAALLLQVAMLRLRMETWSEARVILVFHVIGTAMEIHKTAIGSWVYPEANLFRLGGVPLFTGFMYAAVGSYLARVWRLFDFRFTRHPSLRLLAVLSVAIYVNFLIDHRGIDLRAGLIAVAFAAFAPATVYFKVWREHRTMPLLLGLLLVALFIWFAENLGTLSGTWLYPSQRQHWSVVPVAKLSSWFLLMIVSYTLVARANGIATWPIAPTAPARRTLPLARATHLGLAAAVIATSSHGLGASWPGSDSACPRAIWSRSIPRRATAVRRPGSARSTARPWICRPRTVAVRPPGAISTVSPTASGPRRSVPVTTVPKPGREKTRSTGM